MNQQRTRSNRIISRIKNNPLVAAIIVVGTVVIALSSFTDAVKNLLSLIPKENVPDVTGKWATQILTNPFDKKDTFRLFFEFEVKGDTLLGTLRQTSTEHRYSVEDGILDGKIRGNGISFHKQESSGLGDQKVQYKDFYYGTVSKDEIHFTVQSDRPWGFPPQRFIAKREHRAKKTTPEPTVQKQSSVEAIAPEDIILRISCGKSDSAAFELIRELGRLRAYDDLIKDSYGFLICEKRDTANDAFEVRILGSVTTGTRWTQEESRDIAKELERRGRQCAERGSPYNPRGKNDKRRIKYMFCQKGGKPTSVEVRAITLKADGTPYPEKRLSVNWPE